ncbi:MAG TPA: 6-carboxytetrahydropterin synthase [Candidatus Kapabacteria bacterium]|nr:6-carboxytetrahydropterin synthase [Candidatus Kapabacteria bacterium]
MLYITKQVTFSAAHRLFNPTFSDEQNEQVYDKCNNINGHGHNYVLEVTIAGIPDPKTGYVIDLKKLKNIIDEEIFIKVDHKHLNYDVEFLRGVIPTVEHLAVKFWEILESKITPGKLFKIKIYETPTSYVEYFGDKIDIKNYTN